MPYLVWPILSAMIILISWAVWSVIGCCWGRTHTVRKCGKSAKTGSRRGVSGSNDVPVTTDGVVVHMPVTVVNALTDILLVPNPASNSMFTSPSHARRTSPSSASGSPFMMFSPGNRNMREVKPKKRRHVRSL